MNYSQFPDGFISFYRNLESDFLFGMDGEDRYVTNLKNMPSDWTYRTQQVHYRYDTFGFRIGSESLEDDYILFSGCSHTEGVGLAIEHTYSRLVSSALNSTYYNLAVGGSGIDILVHNMLLFLSCNKKPSKVIIQWPDSHRFYGIERLANDKWNINLFNPHVKVNAPGLKNIWETLNAHTFVFDKSLMMRMQLLMVLHNMGIPVYEVFVSNHPEDQSIVDFYPGNSAKVHDTIFLQGDKARDLCHSGIEANRNLANMIVSAIENNSTPST